MSGNRLRALHRGIYLVGPLMVARARPMSAVLSCGDSAVVSYHSAAVLWELMEPSAVAPAVDVTIPTGARRRRSGVTIHRTELRPEEVTRRDGLTVTTPVRTLYDLAGSMAGRDLERVVAEALSRRLTNQARIEALVKMYEHRPAARRLSELAGAGRGRPCPAPPQRTPCWSSSARHSCRGRK